MELNKINFLLDYINIVTLGICLCIGFVLKEAKIFERFGNQYIPITMLIFGVFINLFTFQKINSIIILSGMISGLASTGLYEMLRNLIHKEKKKK